jgi:hypothetical protein
MLITIFNIFFCIRSVADLGDIDFGGTNGMTKRPYKLYTGI